MVVKRIPIKDGMKERTVSLDLEPIGIEVRIGRGSYENEIKQG